MKLDSWKHGRVDDFFVLQRGFDITESQSEKGSVPVISSSGISYFHSDYKVTGPGVITGRKGKLGSVYYIEENYWPHDTTLWVKDFKGNHPRYIYYFLQNLKLEEFNEALAVPTLNRNNVHRMKCLFPSVREQKRIVEILMLLDTHIEKTEALITAKGKQFGWLTAILLNKAKHKKLAISNFICEVSSRNRDNMISRVLSVTNHSGFILPEEQFERRIASLSLLNYKIVKKGEYAYNPSRINVGSIARLDSWDSGVLSPMYVVFKLDESIINSDYFLHWLNSAEIRQRIKNSAQGSVRETVSLSDLGSIQIVLPSLEQQKLIAHTLNLAQKEIAVLKQLSQKYRQQKNCLMQKLLTGEWYIKNREAELA